MSLLCGVQEVRAQDTTLVATVTDIAGSNAYLDIGTDHGLARGDTLRILNNGVLLGRLLIENVASRRSVVSFAGDAFPITRGARLTVVFRGTGAVREPVPEPILAAEEETPPQAVTPVRTPRASLVIQRGVKLQGRLLMNFSLLSSATKFETGSTNTTHRTFFTPALNLNMTVSNLPSDVRLRLNVRSDYRYSSLSSFSRENTFRAYQLSLEKDLPFGFLQFGRFYDRNVAAGGYWDGASFLYGSREKGIGISVGFMPERSNEGFTTRYPRFSGFAYYETPRRANAPRYRVSASYHEIQPSNEYENHEYFGIEQSFDWGPVSLDQDLQLDRNPATGAWIASLLQANAFVNVSRWLDLRGRFTSREPYRMNNPFSQLSVRRDQALAGFNVRLLGASVGADYSIRFIQGAYESRTYSAHFNTPYFTPAQVSFSGSASRWESDFGTALYANGGLSKSLGAYLLRVDYGFYRSTNSNQLRPIDLHRYSLSAALPFGRKFYLNVRGSLQQSPYLNSFSMHTGLQYRF